MAQKRAKFDGFTLIKQNVGQVVEGWTPNGEVLGSKHTGVLCYAFEQGEGLWQYIEINR